MGTISQLSWQVMGPTWDQRAPQRVDIVRSSLGRREGTGRIICEDIRQKEHTMFKGLARMRCEVISVKTESLKVYIYSECLESISRRDSLW